MDDLKIFNSPEFGRVRTVTIDNEVYFVGIDVAKALEYIKPSQAVIDHCKGIRKSGIPSQGGIQDTNVISEGDVYRLTIKAADQSKSMRVKEKAEHFEKWIFDEVLPSIRKTGSYELPDMSKELQAIFVLDKRTVEMDKRMDRLEFDIPLYGAEADELSKHVKRKGVSILGGKKSNAYNDASICSKLYRDIYGQMKREYGVYGDGGQAMTYKSIQRKNLYGAHKFVDAYEPPFYLKTLIDDANSRINMEV